MATMPDRLTAMLVVLVLAIGFTPLNRVNQHRCSNILHQDRRPWKTQELI